MKIGRASVPRNTPPPARVAGGRPRASAPRADGAPAAGELDPTPPAQADARSGAPGTPAAPARGPVRHASARQRGPEGDAAQRPPRTRTPATTPSGPSAARTSAGGTGSPSGGREGASGRGGGGAGQGYATGNGAHATGTPAGAAPLDTLAQPPQNQAVEGGSRHLLHSRLLKRARAKYASLPLAVALAELRSPLERSYRNAVYCCSLLNQGPKLGAGEQLSTRYCGSRWCLVCNRVRIARAINRYEPHLGRWDGKQFVTLTVPNVTADALPGQIDALVRESRLHAESIRRTDKLAYRALRKLECTYNAERGDYHPHLHHVVHGVEQAEALVRRHLKSNPGAVRAAQDVRPCTDSSLVELFKYFTKLTTRVPGAGPDGRARAAVRPVALDVIFRAMYERRVYQPQGFTAPVAAGQDENAHIGDGATPVLSRVGERVTWEWSQCLTDWVDFATGDTLTGYAPAPRFRAFVESVGATDFDARKDA